MFLGSAPLLRAFLGITRILDDSASAIRLETFSRHLVLNLPGFAVIREFLIRAGMAWIHNQGMLFLRLPPGTSRHCVLRICLNLPIYNLYTEFINLSDDCCYFM